MGPRLPRPAVSPQAQAKELIRQADQLMREAGKDKSPESLAAALGGP
jgi:hypothetical protein